MANEQDVSAIRAVVQQMADRYEARDVDGVLATFAGDDVVMVGTGGDEVRFGLAEARVQVERDIAQSDSLSMGIGDMRVDVYGDAAFLFGDFTISGSAGGADFALPIRATGGLVRTDDGWRIAQFHVSVAFGEQAEGESFPD